MMQTPCGTCKGTGETIKHVCPSCKGSGTEKQKVKEYVEIPRGIRDGMAIIMPGKGHFNEDLLIKVNVGKNPNFVRQGDDVYS